MSTEHGGEIDWTQVVAFTAVNACESPVFALSSDGLRDRMKKIRIHGRDARDPRVVYTEEIGLDGHPSERSYHAIDAIELSHLCKGTVTVHTCWSMASGNSEIARLDPGTRGMRVLAMTRDRCRNAEDVGYAIDHIDAICPRGRCNTGEASLGDVRAVLSSVAAALRAISAEMFGERNVGLARAWRREPEEQNQEAEGGGE